MERTVDLVYGLCYLDSWLALTLTQVDTDHERVHLFPEYHPNNRVAVK